MEDTRDEINQLLQICNLQRIAPQVVEALQESIGLSSTIADDNTLQLGQSKIGGNPDLPDHISWPEWHGKPLGFIGQINLSEMPFLPSVEMPMGILSFFYSAEQETWGFDPNDKGSWRTFYFDDKHHLQRRNAPKNLADKGRYASCSLAGNRTITAPSWDSIYIEELNLTDDEKDYYSAFEAKLDALFTGKKYGHRLLGHPDQIQGEMQLECQLVSNGLSCGNSSGYTSQKAKDLSSGAKDWRMLLQIDSDDNASMMWGDVGRIYYWITRSDLQSRHFESTWMILQCT